MRSRPPESAAAAADAAALMNSRANADERFKGFACTSKHKRTLSMAEIQHEMSNKILKTPSAALLVCLATIHACSSTFHSWFGVLPISGACCTVS
jgi:hypothetical protein